MERRRSVSFPGWVLLLALGGWILGATPAPGAHFDNAVSDLASFCYDCHTLNADLADPDTSFIQASHSTLPTMRTKNGGVAPATFGCTFCHNDPTRTINMKTAFGPFDSKPSQHPVDRTYSKDGNSNVTLGANDYNAIYMADWDNSFATPANQVGCVDCHDANADGGAYPNHPLPGTGSRAAGVNPFMLRNTTAMDNTHAPDSFCLATCHAGTAPGTAGYKMGHYGWAAYDNTTGGMPASTLKEADGTPLKTSRCADCHETHSANVKPNLMGEQRQSSWMIGNTNSYYDPSVCTQCHPDTTFLAAGHGKSGVFLNCGNCHSPSVSHRNATNPRRLSTVPAAPPADMLSLPASFGSNGRDDNFNGVIDEAAESSILLSAESNCSATCHSDKHVHGGNIEGTSGTASCLHCHDPHGKGVDNNARMVRRTVMEKETLYFSTADLFRSDDSPTRSSICNNSNCHVKPLGDTATPGTIMGDVQEHKDANVGYGADCTGCHNHSSTTGGNSFEPVCNSCHTYPGQAVLSGTHALSSVHDKHVAQDNVGGYGFACSTCHFKYTHNQSGVNDAGEWASRFQSNNVNIKFDGAWNPKNANGPTYAGVAADNTLADNVYAPGVGGTGTCAGLYCHGDSAAVSFWPSGTDTTPEWDTPSTAACGTCHRAAASNPPQSFAHQTHADNTAAGYGISCRKCHYQTTSDGLTITGRPGHLNRQSQVTFDPADPLLSSGSYSGTATVGDSGTTVGTCANIYCHSPGNRTGPPFDNAALGQPDWKTAGPLACNACHGASGQTSPRVGMPDYPNGSPKTNSHAKHLDDGFTCKVCHFATTTTDTTIADRSVHVNGAYDAVNDNLARHAFAYSASNCSAAVCHGGWSSGPNLPAWGAGPYACDICHMNTAGAAATSDFDQFAYDNGMAKVNADQWNGAVNGSGHGRSSAYPSGNPGAGSRFASCTANCHTASIGHDNSVNFFRLRTYSGIVDFSDTDRDPASQQDDNLICLDCHSSAGDNPVKAARLVEQNHYGTWDNNKHTASTMGGAFCVDCHDPHGDSNHYMIQDNVTKTSDGVYGIPAEQAPVARFTMQNLDGASGLDSVYDWGDYVKSTSPYTGLCQTCHASSGGANYFNTGVSGYTDTHNKAGSPPSRCTSCHLHGNDFSPSCTACHGEATAGNGSPPSAPFAGNRVWPATVDNASTPAGMGNHRSRPASGIDNSSHEPFMADITGCVECHTNTPGTGSDHNLSTNVNATMTNVANHAWYTGAAASWSPGALDGGVAGGSVIDDSCSNIDCHSSYYGSPANQYRSATPTPYTRYWINQTLWDCYTCHAYDGRTVTSRPSGADNTMATGMHTAHVGTAQMACSNCHDVTGYVTTSFTGNHKNGFIDWDFSGAPNPFGTTPAYSVAGGSRAPTDDNTAAGHLSWGSCSNLYCHSTVQASPPSGGTGVVYANPAWDNALSGQCGTCHAGDGVSGNLTRMSAGSHDPHLASGYAMPCTTCHTGAGTGTTAHADGTIQVPMGDGSWRIYTLSAASTIYDRAAAPGMDNANAAPGDAYGRCSQVPCHSDGSGGAPRITPAIWGDTQAAATNCTYCHGGNASTGAAVSTGSHTKHVVEKGFACGKCHAGTVSAASDNSIVAFDNHVNGVKDVLFSPEIGGTYDNVNKTCRNTYCHGTDWTEPYEPFWYTIQPIPKWGNPASVPNCGVCHLDQGAAISVSYNYHYSEIHHPHSFADRIKIACEVCHATGAIAHPNTTHAGGDDNPASERTVEVRFTDNGANRIHGETLYLSKNLWTDPYTGLGVSPAYTEGTYTAGDNDYHNEKISWTQGTCSNVWCHGNANPLGWKGQPGANVYRTPSWNQQSCYSCHVDPITSSERRNMALCANCHRGPATAAAMAGNDNLSNAHITHVATDRYAFTCDECHAWTVENDNTTTLILPTGLDNHLNGVKTVRFATTLRTTTVDQSGGAYDDVQYRCGNLYCHSDGTDNVTFGAPRDNTISWNSATGGTCTTCHGGNTASGAAMATYAHGKHVQSGYLCSSCHGLTVAAGQDNVLDATTGYANHVNGQKDVAQGNGYTFTWNGGTKDCSNISCHGGNGANWITGVGTLKCQNCHLSAADSDQYQTASDTWFNNDAIGTLNTTEWGYSGHGKTAGTYDVSGHGAADFPGGAGTGDPCLYCHDSGVGHKQSSDPFRLKDQTGVAGYSTMGWSATCMVCHSKTQSPPGYGSSLGFTNKTAAVDDRVDTAHYGSKHAVDNTSGGRFCWDCHDPHGDRSDGSTGNIYMIQATAMRKSDGAYGYRGTGGAITSSIVFRNDAAPLSGGDWADNTTPYNGICNVCHTTTLHYTASSGDGHNRDKVCITCHEHDKEFAATCNTCHGDVGGAIRGDGSSYPPEGPTAARSGKTYDWAETQGVNASRGDHRRHAGASLYNKDCALCHLSGYGSDPQHNNDKPSATMTGVATYGTWSGGALPGYQSVTDDSCSNISCHSPYSAENPANVYMSATPFAYTRYWIDNVTWDCYTCHAYDGRTATSRPGGADNTMSTGSHAMHVSTGQMDCTRCHASGAYTIDHKSGFVDWSFAGAPNPYASTPAYSIASGSRAPTDNTVANGLYGNCANVYCHSVGQTSAGGALTGAAGEYRQPMWDNTFGGRCGDCHAGDGVTDNTASVIASGSHTTHAGSAGSLNYPCSTCHNGLGRGAATHVDNGVHLAFGSVGAVSLATTVYSQGSSHIVGDGFGNCTVNYCHGTGTPALSGGANQDAAPNLPAWGTAGTALCGSCHGSPNGATNYPGKASDWPASGAHARHLDPSDPAGPHITACTDCHTANTLSTHGDGTVDFRTRYDNTAATTKALTQSCDPCHGTGVAQAKANWDTVAALDCLTCHGATPAYTLANATGRTAPDMAGDNTSYGANVRGHNRATAAGPYPVTNNPAANRTCDSCHDLLISHIDGTDNTTFAGNRLLATVNGNATGSTVSGLCAACHTTSGSSPATKKSINAHGNAGYAGNLENQPASNPPSPGAFQAACNQCHEPHGMVNVSAAPAGVNLWMINPTVTVTTGITQSPVRLFARTGANSFDNTGTVSDLCRACHGNTSNPGYPMTYNVAGQHAAPAYNGDERGKDCSGCHSHNQDGDIATVDGLMPLACNACHSYPGVAGGTWTQAMSAVHAKHVGTPADTSNSRQYECIVCHFNYSHNGNGLSAGQAWPGTYYTFVNIDFDPSINPANANGPMYNGVATPTTGNGGTGACAGIYCHGNSASQSTWGGTTTATPPKWDNTVTASCGTCHRADATMPQGNHPAHLSAVYGPGAAAFTASGTCSEGTGCHTAYGFSPTTSHANGQPSFRTSPGDNTPVGLEVTGICQNCHTTYTSANIPVSGDTLVRTRANWDDNTFYVDCLTCHNGTAAGTQATANLDGSGGVAAAIEGTIYTMQHGIQGIGCGWCHGYIGHIGANRPVGSNPYRLAGYYFTSYPPLTQLGQIDWACNACHGVFSGYDHTWRVSGSGSSGPETKGATDTHPTTVLSVGTGKDRWYQLPGSTHMPLYGDLLDINYNPSGGDNNYVLCVSCHDPHGVGTSPLPSSVRRFSGQNTDAKGNKALRFNYSSGTPTALCSQCHK